MERKQPLEVVFYATENGNEPVREWLRELQKNDKKSIGEDIKTVQFGWPIGMPVVRKLDSSLWEIRTILEQGIARVVFTVFQNEIVLLHGFIKKSQKTPKEDLDLAKKRMKNLKEGA
jgi:phage-related protein